MGGNGKKNKIQKEDDEFVHIKVMMDLYEKIKFETSFPFDIYEGNGMQNICHQKSFTGRIQFGFRRL